MTRRFRSSQIPNGPRRSKSGTFSILCDVVQINDASKLGIYTAPTKFCQYRSKVCSIEVSRCTQPFADSCYYLFIRYIDVVEPWGIHKDQRPGFGAFTPWILEYKVSHVDISVRLSVVDRSNLFSSSNVDELWVQMSVKPASRKRYTDMTFASSRPP